MSKIVMYGGTAHEVDERGRIIGQANLGTDVIANMLIGVPIVYKFMMKFVMLLTRFLVNCRDFIVTEEERVYWAKKEKTKLRFVEGSGLIVSMKNMLIIEVWSARAGLGMIATPFYRIYRMIRKGKKKEATPSNGTGMVTKTVSPIVALAYIGMETVVLAIPMVFIFILFTGSAEVGCFPGFLTALVVTLLMNAQNKKERK